jgi:hypothetical protein
MGPTRASWRTGIAGKRSGRPKGDVSSYTLAPIRNGPLDGHGHREDDLLPDRLPRRDREDRMNTTASRRRSIVKAITYRIIIVCLDFLVI